MLTSYDNCDSLIEDMRHHLLTKKSSTAIHKELSLISQNVYKYGSKVEQLFVDLTVAQADGDQNAYKILRPQNEKIAIKSFIDGLRNREIRTIFSARNYGTLKDIIRTAQNEELSYNRPKSHDMAYVGYQNHFYNNRGNYRKYSNRHPNRTNNRYIHRGNSRVSFNRPNQNYFSKNFRKTNNMSRGSTRCNRSNRGRPGRTYTRTRTNNVHVIETGVNNMNLNDEHISKSNSGERRDFISFMLVTIIAR